MVNQQAVLSRFSPGSATTKVLVVDALEFELLIAQRGSMTSAVPSAAQLPARCGRGESSIASRYAASSPSVVRSQENRSACARAPAASACSARGVREQVAEHLRPLLGIVSVHEHAGHAVGYRGGQPPDCGGHDRRAACLRLQRDQTERLVVARHDRQVGGAVVVGDDVTGSPAGRTGRSTPVRARKPSRAARSAVRARNRSEPRARPPAIRAACRRATAAAARSTRSGALSG